MSTRGVNAYVASDFAALKSTYIAQVTAYISPVSYRIFLVSSLFESITIHGKGLFKKLQAKLVKL